LLNPLIHSRFLRAGVLQGTLACAGRIPPVARMRLLPGSDTRRIFSIPEVIFIARLLQPRPLTGALAGLLTLLPSNKSAGVRRSGSWEEKVPCSAGNYSGAFQTSFGSKQREPPSNKITAVAEENPNRRKIRKEEGRKNLSESFEEESSEEDPFPHRRFWATSISPVTGKKENEEAGLGNDK
jgi:hypothetical protein